MLRHLIARVLLQRNASGNNTDELGGEEFKLPRTASLVIVIAYNIMLQVRRYATTALLVSVTFVLRKLSFFVVISSSGKYVEHLGGNATFSGIAIGIPTLISGIALFPMTRYDKGRYATALHIGCFTGLLGQVAYAIAYRANFLYLILVGRCLSGISFSGFMYCKRYCTDPSIVGIRRRTTLSSWLVIGQAVGMTLGPFLGGVLYKVGFQSAIFNGYTSPGWVMASCHGVFWLIVARYFEDVHTTEMNTELYEIPIPVSSIEEGNRITDSTLLPPSVTPRSPSQPEESSAAQLSHITRPQWGVIVCMCWFSMVCFFVLGSWEANLPIFGAATPTLNWSPFTAGNFIALTGITGIPILPCEYAVRTSYPRSTITCFRDRPGSVWAFGIHFASGR
ncbi:hypothetical protein JVT61DRAFT_5138 [Boletus reticuloceps]|uniref:MFS general substrate transporter n=1 Tax=Boletus reticuloceps TaxID=495285 RepID=A0A8I2YXX8_9AGAM|nr:hypothetical protein JVT61DRAFT_5138 [Boletus reticuloceps]